MNTNFDDTSYNQDEIADIRLFDLSICNKKANTQCTFKVNTLEHGVLEDFESVELFYSEEDLFYIFEENEDGLRLCFDKLWVDLKEHSKIIYNEI